ncbi:hypothetical protein Ahy_B03g064894 [Arachis hypogaea]|uniref:FAD-dependent oxidoreductase 2 FAD-binding domain-containing protein n=1 Tax=Arachis hypogaea TaxID=3818 RepID=A0A445A0L6_ARAHY|nr:hypothetical protein Ahy_B03g064894 [Arachis hypogaea]
MLHGNNFQCNPPGDTQPFPLPPFSIPNLPSVHPILPRQSLAWLRVRRRRGSLATVSSILRLRFSPSVSLFLSCSLSLSSVGCRGNLVASHAGNRGYPPNKVVCTEGPDRVRELIAIGASFDHGEDGNLHLVREGGHSHRRIFHAADMTEKEIESALLKSVVNKTNIFVFEHHFAIDILTCQDGSDITCVGIDTLNTETLEVGKVVRFLSKVTWLASGGAGHIYPKTTNSLVATGDGIAMAHRPQAVISNME